MENSVERVPGSESTDDEPAESDNEIEASSRCPHSPVGVPWEAGSTAHMEELQPPSPGEAGVDAVVYPRPGYEGRLWSQWGQGIALADGRFLSAIGDHAGVDGNSFIYEFDARTGILTQIADVLSIADHAPGDFGFGKIHAQMVAGPCGRIFTSTYWGTRRDLRYTETYRGDLLIQIDPQSRTIDTGTVLLPEHGTASMASSPRDGLLFAEAADPFGEKTGSFLVIDATTAEIVFQDEDPLHGGYRSIAVDAKGRAYVTWDESGLARYDPATQMLEALDTTLPGEILRAATSPDREGNVYAVTRDPPVFFVIRGDGSLSQLDSARGYTTSLALDPSGERFFYVPDAHGGAWAQGAPLIAVDTATGEEEVVVELNPLLEEHLGLRAGGSYNVAADPSGERVYVGLNAGDPAGRSAFGEVVLIVVTLP